MEVVTSKRKMDEDNQTIYGTRGKRRKRFRTHQAKGLLPAPLPDEIICHVMSFLSRPDDALRFMATCKRFYNAGRWHTPYWRQFYPMLKQVRVILPSSTHRYERIWACKKMCELFYKYRDENPFSPYSASLTKFQAMPYEQFTCGNLAHYDKAKQPCPPEDIPADACNAVLVQLQRQHHHKKKSLVLKLTRNSDTLRRDLEQSWEKKNFWDRRVRQETDELNDTKAQLQDIESGVKKNFIKMPKLGD
jgi:hypothetical protein